MIGGLLASPSRKARKSVPEDERIHPRVGVVIVKDGRVPRDLPIVANSPSAMVNLFALEKKLADVSLAGSNGFTRLLNPALRGITPKFPCATRLAERKVARVRDRHA